MIKTLTNILIQYQNIGCWSIQIKISSLNIFMIPVYKYNNNYYYNYYYYYYV